ncbi:MAG TPA: hypothetical protein VGS22_25515 [Thermoanaerobaculia bacterium]|jgi:hypothetical protein|nr:hypothetical protein [Thermoanaerobaculia bacterium]
MWDMALASIKLFIAGKLFQKPADVVRQNLKGVAVTVVVTLGLFAAGLSLPVSAGIAGFAGGMLQPYLFKDLKFR